MAFNSKKCLKFRALADNCTIALSHNGITNPYYFSKDSLTWQKDSITLNKNGTCFVKGTAFPGYSLTVNSFSFSADVEIISGNVMSLVDDGAGALDAVELRGFWKLFLNCTKLKSIHGELLPATTVRSGCYMGMFQGCTGLTTIPEGLLPATTLEGNCYQSMFEGCTGLRTLPVGLLPALAITKQAYDGMFKDCTYLTTVPYGVFSDGATFGGIEYAIDNMFSGCSRLNEIHVPFTSWGEVQTRKWVEGVAASGNFYAPSSLPIIYDTSHIPVNWNKYNEGPEPPPPPPPPPEVHGSAAVVLLGNINIGSTF